jgi:hypothetical protein
MCSEYIQLRIYTARHMADANWPFKSYISKYIIYVYDGIAMTIRRNAKAEARAMEYVTMEFTSFL